MWNRRDNFRRPPQPVCSVAHRRGGFITYAIGKFKNNNQITVLNWILNVQCLMLQMKLVCVSENTFGKQVESFTIKEIREALHRRGPDSLGSKKVLLNLNKDVLLSTIEDFERELVENSVLQYGDFSNGVVEMCFIGATLQLRGVIPVKQPFVDSSENILVYNGI